VGQARGPRHRRPDVPAARTARCRRSAAELSAAGDGAALDGLVALVTGASSGIGEATAVALAAAGAAVAVAARRTTGWMHWSRASRPRRPRARGRARRHGRRCLRRGCAAHRGQLGALDVLVNNAGVMLLGPIETADVDEWTRMVNTNVLGLMYMTHAALPHLLRHGGAVVQMSSAAGRVTRPSTAVYNASKFAVGCVQRRPAPGGRGRGVRVIVVEPGRWRRRCASTSPTPVHARRWSAAAGLRPLDPEDVARTVVYAVSQRPTSRSTRSCCGPPARPGDPGAAAPRWRRACLGGHGRTGFVRWEPAVSGVGCATTLRKPRSGGCS
jgi:NADP-dependent 3-hydroxy acid dehydrogenase YdfG